MAIAKYGGRGGGRKKGREKKEKQKKGEQILRASQQIYNCPVFQGLLLNAILTGFQIENPNKI